MKVLIIAHFAGSPTHGMVFGHYFLAREWVRRGHDVTIVAASFAHTRYRQPDVTGLLTEQSLDGIRYIWVRVPHYTPESRFWRVANILCFTAMARLIQGRYGRPDAVVCSSHHPFPIFTASRIARRNGAKLVFEVRDLWPLTLMELGGATLRNPFIAAMQRAEDFAYRESDAVVSVLPYACDYMVAHGMSQEKFVYIPNGIDETPPAPAPLPEEHQRVLAGLKAGGGRLIGYAGRVGLANALDAGVLSLAHSADRRWRFVVLGDGPYAASLRQRVDEAGLGDRFALLSPVAKDQVASFLAEIDVAYLGLQDQPLFRFGVSPTKLNDYMLAGKPVLCAIGARVDAMEESQAGVVCRPEDSREIAAALDQLGALEPGALAALGRRGRDWILANRGYERLGARFLDVLGH